MTFRRLQQLVLESFDAVDYLANAYQNAYKVIFDTDELQVITAKPTGNASYYHESIAVVIRLIHKQKPYHIYHKLRFWKFPKDETNGLDNQEWLNMLKTADKFPKQELSKELLATKNKQIKYDASIYLMPTDKKKPTYFDGNMIADSHESNKTYYSIGDIIKWVKSILDKGDSDNVQEEPVEPVSPTKRKPVFAL